MESSIVIRELPEKGWTITADCLGICYVNGEMASRPIIPADPNESAFIWLPKTLGHAKRVKLLLTGAQVKAVKDQFARRHMIYKQQASINNEANQ